MYGAHGWSRTYTWRLLISDAFVLGLVMVAAHAVRFGFDPDVPVSGPSAPPYWFVSLAIAALWLGALSWNRSREARILGHGPQEFQRVVSASWNTFAVVAIIGFLTQWQISRGYLLFALPVGTIFLVLYRAMWRRNIQVRRDRGLLQAQTLVVGPYRTTEQMVRRLQKARRAGYHVIGVCLASDGAGRSEIHGVPVLGPASDAAQIAQQIGAEYVLHTGSDAMSLRESRRLGWALEGTGIGLIVAPAMVDVAGPRVSVTPVEGLPLLHVDEPTFSGGKYWLKTTTDIVGASLVLLIAWPLLLVLAILVKASSPGPVLFRQVRIGRDLKPFDMLKFRSMYTDAEERLAAVMDKQSAGNDVMFKMKDDPRVTPVGRFLRRFSLDELPQIFNVLRGEMSLVGPRPPLPREVEQWEEQVRRRQLVKPGITGLWQVSGRSDLTWDETVRLDLYYTENWSPTGDIVIMLKTVWAVMAGKGAY